MPQLLGLRKQEQKKVDGGGEAETPALSEGCTRVILSKAAVCRTGPLALFPSLSASLTLDILTLGQLPPLRPSSLVCICPHLGSTTVIGIAPEHLPPGSQGLRPP